MSANIRNHFWLGVMRLDNFSTTAFGVGLLGMASMAVAFTISAEHCEKFMDDGKACYPVGLKSSGLFYNCEPPFVKPDQVDACSFMETQVNEVQSMLCTPQRT